MGTLANNADPFKMQHNAAFHQGLHCLKIKRLKQPNFEISSCDPLKYTVGSPIQVVSICMGKSIRIQRVNGK